MPDEISLWPCLKYIADLLFAVAKYEEKLYVVSVVCISQSTALLCYYVSI